VEAGVNSRSGTDRGQHCDFNRMLPLGSRETGQSHHPNVIAGMNPGWISKMRAAPPRVTANHRLLSAHKQNPACESEAQSRASEVFGHQTIMGLAKSRMQRFLLTLFHTIPGWGTAITRITLGITPVPTSVDCCDQEYLISG
jgi:hypothetical protein